MRELGDRAAMDKSVVRVFLRSARAAGRGARKWRNPPVQPRFGGHDLRVFLKSAICTAFSAAC
jgi:hypothetical protein